MRRPIERIAVFGGGIVALSAACAFARALPNIAVTLVATPPDPAALADRLPGSLPAIHAFHDAIGFPESELIRKAGAAPRLAIRVENWSASGAPWWHAYGPFEPPTLPLHWQIARDAGDPAPLDALHPGAALAAAGRFDPTSEHALTLDPEGYRTGLAALARHCRVALAEGTVAALDCETDGRVAAVTLAGGRRIAADLFIDATGPAAALLARLDGGFEDWSALLPCDRLILARSAPDPSPVETVAALDCGWRWRAPGRSASLNGLAYAAALTPAEVAARRFTAETGLVPIESIPFRPGRRRASWIANVVAIGDAAVVVDPLEATNLHLAHSAIRRAIDLMPDRDFAPPLIAEYNRRTAAEATRVRDFLAAHYVRSGRTAGELWRAAAAAPLPDSLARTLALFEARGRLPHFDEETFARADWQQALLGLGVAPRHHDPATLAMPGADRSALLAMAARRIAATVAAALPCRVALAKMLN
ncbi:MAG TPA: tryptophan halogenase family protein [Sphingomonas sp.]|nr:tryptophan halogenase family protein [Sphingomonas sp.]